MIPLKSLIKTDGFPYVNWFIIILNAALFVYFYNAPSVFFLDYGVVPAKLGMPYDIVPFYEKVYPFFTYMFVHGNIFHFLFNMLFLYIFGGAVESRLGHLLYIFVYAVFGLVAAMAQVVMTPSDTYPMIGASGAIAGVMGAYIVFFPMAKIRTIILIIVADVYAFIIVGLWFFFIILAAYRFSYLDGGVAWWAHIGGFAAGFLFAVILRLKKGFAG